MPAHLISPHGGTLSNLVSDQERAEELRQLSWDWPSWDLTPRQLCDLELLANGGYSPLQGFLCRNDYESVCEEMRLADRTIWPIPITLDVSEQLATSLDSGSMLAVRDFEGVMIAALKVEDVWQPDLMKEAEQVFGTSNVEHPGVSYVRNRVNPWYVGGKLECLQLPKHYDFTELRLTPQQLREKFATLGWHRVVAFQTRNPMHRAHQEITLRAAKELEANLLIHPVVGMTKPGDVDHFTRVRCYMLILKHYPHHAAMLSLLPLAMRMAGPREAIWHAIIRKNYGCTQLIVGRDHAGPGCDSSGRPFYAPYEAQELFQRYQDELGIQMVPFAAMVHLEDRDEYVLIDKVSKGADIKTLSGTELRERLAADREVPSWFSFPKVIAELKRTYPPRNKRGSPYSLQACRAPENQL